MSSSPLFARARNRFHKRLSGYVLTVDSSGVPSNADSDNTASVAIAKEIVARLGGVPKAKRFAGQTLGKRFEEVCVTLIEELFPKLAHLRPGQWQTKRAAGIADFEQYAHLDELAELATKHPDLTTILGTDYLIKPDLVLMRHKEEDAAINKGELLVDETTALHASLRRLSGPLPLLHASISCKWTIRSDRSQNSRSEALNLIRNRKGHQPHIVVVTAEPLPSRLASVALGTGDIDCVYHFALPELQDAVSDYPDSKEMLHVMVQGKRLKDISDLPLDLAV